MASLRFRKIFAMLCYFKALFRAIFVIFVTIITHLCLFTTKSVTKRYANCYNRVFLLVFATLLQSSATSKRTDHVHYGLCKPQNLHNSGPL